MIELRACLHDTGATFIPAPVHSSSILWLSIRLHDVNTKSHIEAIHTAASSPRKLYRSEIFIPVRKLVSISCKRITVVLSSMKSLSEESGTGSACAVFGIQSNKYDVTITSVDTKCHSPPLFKTIFSLFERTSV